MKKSILSLGLLFTINTASAATLEVHTRPVLLGALPKNGVAIPFLEIQLTAQGGPAEFTGFEISRGGLSTDDDFGRIWVRGDHYRQSRKREFIDNTATLEFYSPVKIKEDETQTFLILANLNFSGNGKTANFKLNKVLTEAETTARPTYQEIVQQKQMTIKKRTRPSFKIRCKNRKCVRVPR